MTQVRADAQLFAAAREREQACAGRRAARERRRGPGWLRRPVPLAAAAACAAVLAVGAGVLGAALVGDDGGPARRAPSRRRSTRRRRPGARARARRRRTPATRGSSSTACRPPGADACGRCGCAAAQDAPRPAGALFGVDAPGDGEAAVPGSLDGVDEVLVSSEPAGGSQQPTRTPILAAPV